MANKLPKLVSLFTLFLFVISPLPANNWWEKGQEEKKKTTSSIYTSKTVQIKQTKENIQLNAADGSILLLPKIEKTYVEDAPLPLNYTTLADLDVSLLSNKKIQEKLIEQKEMQELSTELGIQIRSNKHLDLYREIAHWIGVPYRYGAMSKKAVDCSGLINLIYLAVYNKELPRVSLAMSNTYKEDIDKVDLEPGDLVFFATRRRRTINHVGIYVGDGKFIHASRSQGVIIDSLSNGYYVRSWRRGTKVE